MSQKISYDEFMKRLRSVTTSIIPISEFNGINSPIKYKCLECGYEWEVKTARNTLRGYGCPECANKKRSESNRKVKLKTEEQFRAELAVAQPNLIPNDVYKGVNKKFHCICKIHNCDVYKTPYHMINRRQGCPLCNAEKKPNSIRYTHDTYIQKLSLINSNVEVLSQYTKIKDRINVRCKVCGYEWNPIAESLIAKIPCGCPSCANNAIITPQQFRERLAISHPNLILLLDYTRANNPVHVKCIKCGSDFWITPNKLQQGQQCYCTSESHGENHIRVFLETNNIPYERFTKFDGLVGVGGRQLSYDFYVPHNNMLIEYQGEQHDFPADFCGNLSEEQMLLNFEKQQEHDRRKREYAINNNINLLEIWYWDFKNINSILENNLLCFS